MNKKLGPLPVWAWIAISAATIAGVYLLRRNQTGGSGTQLGPNVLDPNAIDPATGLTYGQELGAGVTPTDGGGGGSLGGVSGDPGVSGVPIPDPTVPGDTSPPTGTPTDLTGGFLDELTGFSQIAAALGYTKGGSSPAGSTKSGSHPTTRRRGGKTQYWWDGKWHTKPQGQHHKPGKTHKPGGGKGSGSGTRRSHPPKVKKHHRAPAHPHEQVHAQSPSHLREQPAHKRVKVRKPKKRRRGH